MLEPNDAIIVIEDNATRAGLYELWLQPMTVRVALTRQQVSEQLDEPVLVAILAQEFGEGDATEVLEEIRSRHPICQIMTTTKDRDNTVPKLEVDTHLTKPIFEKELTETVDNLLLRAAYSRALSEYYHLTTELTSLEVSDEASEGDEEQRARLESRVEDLRDSLSQYGERLDTDDMHAIMETVTTDDHLPDPEEVSGASKYAPDKCSGCGRPWGAAVGDSPEKGYRRLGSFVWRCTECGKVQMQTDPTNQRTTPF